MPRPAKPWYRKDRKTWYAWVGGRQVRLGSTYREALGTFRRLALDDGKVPGPDLSVAELCDLFLGHVERDRKTTTYDWYVGHLQSWTDHCGGRRAEVIRPKDVTAWLARHPTWGPSTRRGSITAVKRSWSWATAEGHLSANHLAKVVRPPMGRRKVMTFDDAKRLTAAIRPGSALADLVEGLAETGCRPGELATLEARSVDLTGGRATVRGKSGERTIWLSARAVALFEKLAALRPDGPIFLNERGRPWDRNAMRCAFRRLGEKTGIDGACAYAFRHLYASQSIERGIDPLTLAQLMGHSDVKMLKEFYVRHRDEQMRAAAERAVGNG